MYEDNHFGDIVDFDPEKLRRVADEIWCRRFGS
jgi:hypothetical protein